MIKSYFLDNEVYGAEDVNTVIAELFSGGITVPFSDSSTPTDFNGIAGSVINRGVADIDGGGFLIYKAGDHYYAAKGSAVFDDGCMIVSTAAEPVTVSSGVKNYVYLEHNTGLNICGIICSTSAGGSGTIPLAEIGEDGAITDKRIFAVSKVASLSANITKSVTQEFTFWSGGEKEYIIDMVYAGFNYVLLESGREKGFVSLDKTESFLAGTYDWMYFKKEGSILKVTTKCTGTGLGSRMVTMHFV